MKQIIVPTDFSDSAWKAFLYAVKLAESFNSEITILNSFQAPQAIATDLISGEGILQEASENGLQKCLDKINNAGLGKNLIIHSQSIEGDLVEALNTQIKEYDKQLIVMGSLGKSGAIGKLIGSNASKVVEKVNCPVFIIPPKAASFSSQLVFAADFNKAPEEVHLAFLKELFLLFQSTKLDVVHVLKDDEDEMAGKIALDSFLRNIPYELRLISDKNVSSALDKHISKSDLLILIKKKKGLFEQIFKESVTKKLALHASIPLLVLKSQ